MIEKGGGWIAGEAIQTQTTKRGGRLSLLLFVREVYKSGGDL